MTEPLRFRAAAALPGQAGLSVEEVDVAPPETGEASVVSQVLDLTAGRGVDAAVEAYGSAATTEQAIAVTGMGGISIQASTSPPGERVGLPPGAERAFVSSVYRSGRTS